MGIIRRGLGIGLYPGDAQGPRAHRRQIDSKNDAIGGAVHIVGVSRGPGRPKWGRGPSRLDEDDGAFEGVIAVHQRQSEDWAGDAALG